MNKQVLIFILSILFVSCSEQKTTGNKARETEAQETKVETVEVKSKNPDGPIIQGEWLNIQKIDEKIAQSKAIKETDLLGSWEIVTSVSYIMPDNEEAIFMENGYEGYSYSFTDNHKFTVDATIDSDGEWKLLSGGHILYLHNNLRDDEENHKLILTGDTLEWAITEKNSYVYQVLVRKK